MEKPPWGRFLFVESPFTTRSRGMDSKLLMAFPHVVSAQQFDTDWLEKFFQETNKMVSVKKCDVLKGMDMISFFYEKSTRTRASFEIAFRRCGGMVVFSTENAREFSSVAKGETLADTIKVLCEYKPDVIVLRYDQEGGALEAAKVSCVPIINGGDGQGQHPTQALLDLYTIKKELGYINGIHVAMVGDVEHSRTVRSLCYLLAKYPGIKVSFVSPLHFRVKGDIKEYLAKHRVPFMETGDLKSVAPYVDVIYQTRVQVERIPDSLKKTFDFKDFVIDNSILRLMKHNAIVMHPLPRVDEIAPEVDSDPRAAYFRQAGNGLYCRMALLKMMLAPNA